MVRRTILSSGIIIALLLIIPAAFGQEVDFQVAIYEAGKVTSYYDDYYIVQVIGNLTLINTQNSSLFNIDIPFQLPGLQIRPLNSTGKATIFQNQIAVHALDPLERLSFQYKISGITSDWFRTDQAILKTAIEAGGDLRIYSNLMGSLKKAEIENISQGIDGRLISFDVYNPTAFRFKIDLARITKTVDLNPSIPIAVWDFPQDINEMRVGGQSIFPVLVRGQEKEYLGPYERWVVDFYDLNVTEGEVYWLQTDIYLADITFTGFGNLTLYDQDDLFIILSNITNVTENLTSLDIPFFEDRVFLRKFISDRQMTYGKIIDMELLINNLGSSPISPRMTDALPAGFRIIDSGSASVSSLNISWEDFTVDPRGSKRMRMRLEYVDNDSLGLDYFMPAKMVAGGQVTYSQAVPFIRKYVPEKRVFLQKRVKFLNEDDIEVTISVQNLGEAALRDLVLKEFLSAENEFKEVSQVFESKGVWKIPSIEQGKTWETRYVTDQTNVLSNLPEIYGIPTVYVMKTIIMTHSVSTHIAFLTRKKIEIIGIVVILAAVAYYFVPANILRSRRKRDIRRIAVIEQEIAGLKHATGTPQEKIEQEHKELLHKHGKQDKKTMQDNESKAHAAGQSKKHSDHESFHTDLKHNQELLEKMKKSFGDK